MCGGLYTHYFLSFFPQPLEVIMLSVSQMGKLRLKETNDLLWDTAPHSTRCQNSSS